MAVHWRSGIRKIVFAYIMAACLLAGFKSIEPCLRPFLEATADSTIPALFFAGISLLSFPRRSAGPLVD